MHIERSLKMSKITKVTVAYKFEDLGWSIDTYVTPIEKDQAFLKRFWELHDGNGIITAKVIEREEVNDLTYDIDEKVNRSIIQ